MELAKTDIRDMKPALRKILWESLFKEAESIPVLGDVFKHVPVLKVPPPSEGFKFAGEGEEGNPFSQMSEDEMEDLMAAPNTIFDGKGGEEEKIVLERFAGKNHEILACKT